MRTPASGLSRPRSSSRARSMADGCAAELGTWTSARVRSVARAARRSRRRCGRPSPAPAQARPARAASGGPPPAHCHRCRIGSRSASERSGVCAPRAPAPARSISSGAMPARREQAILGAAGEVVQRRAEQREGWFAPSHLAAEQGQITALGQSVPLQLLMPRPRRCAPGALERDVDPLAAPAPGTQRVERIVVAACHGEDGIHEGAAHGVQELTVFAVAQRKMRARRRCSGRTPWLRDS